MKRPKRTIKTELVSVDPKHIQRLQEAVAIVAEWNKKNPNQTLPFEPPYIDAVTVMFVYGLCLIAPWAKTLEMREDDDA